MTGRPQGWAARVRSVSGTGPAPVVAAAALLTLAVWRDVFLGRVVLLGTDILYGLPPWHGTAGAHVPRNGLLSDQALEILPWQTAVARDLMHGILPLWNPDVMAGVTLLAQGQPAPFSIFNLAALPFPPAVGLSLAMIAKLWVAGLGMAFYLRAVGSSRLGATLGGLAYGTCSFMVCWLGWPQTSVAAIMPWLFGATERYLAGRRLALAGVAAAVALQFLAGHAETSIHLALVAALYVLIRAPGSPRGWAGLAGLAGAAAVGTLVAGIQLLPFLDAIGQSSFIAARAGKSLGAFHLAPGALSSWVVPNLIGNPAIDGLHGHDPNYNESTGFVGLTALMLAPLGAWGTWAKSRSLSIALLLPLGLAGLVVYGPLAGIFARLPLISGANNARLLVVMCFFAAALGGLGLDQLPRLGRLSPALTRLSWPGAAGVLLLIAVGPAVLKLRGSFDTLLPPVHGHRFITVWVAVGALTAVSAALLGLAAAAGGRAAPMLLCGLALAEGFVFAAPYNPKVPIAEAPPPSVVASWLAGHQGAGYVAGLGFAVTPEASTLYGLRDARGYEALSSERYARYWTQADPRFSSQSDLVRLYEPGIRWLAAAGIEYVAVKGDQPPPGTTEVLSAEGVTVGSVPDPRPFAYAATAAVAAGGETAAARDLGADPLATVVVEGPCCPPAGHALVSVTARSDQRVNLAVRAAAPATVVVLQQYAPGWTARIDGAPVDLRPADVMFQSVRVPAGNHRVTITYEPSDLPAAVALSAAGLVLLLGLVGWALLRPRP